MTEAKQHVMLALFEEHLKQALKWYKSPEKLGEASPLASPYFLSQAGTDPAELVTAEGRGKALQTALREAAATLWGGAVPRTLTEMQAALYAERQTPGTARYAYLVLELRCFQQFLQPRRVADIWEQEQFLFGSKSEHYRDFETAVQRLGAALVARCLPALRLAQAPAPPVLIGYQAAAQRVLLALRQGQCVMLSGAGGVGKTSLGAAIVADLKDKAVFWFTLRPTLNDHLSSFLFALGHFLHRQGAARLWQFLLAAGGKLENPALLLALAREDLLACPHAPVLCLDELERLQVWQPEEQRTEHLQILEFIEGLRGVAPMLLIGQRPLLEADVQQTLAGLSAAQIGELWQTRDLSLSEADAQALARYTGGNPRLLTLCLALQQQGETLTDLMLHLPAQAALWPIFRRIWTRLDSAKRRLLQQLAVFRGFAPAAPWDQTVLAALIQQRLLEQDRYGGVALLPALRELIYSELSGELRQQLHQTAAETCLGFAEYTAAAYHCWQGGQAVAAVRLWYPQMQGEILRGQAGAALPMFEGIPRNALPAPERKALDIIRAELRKLQGDLTQGLAALEAVDWTEPSETTIHLHALRGDFQNALGYPDAALQSYQAGVETTIRLLGQLSNLHYRQGMVHERQKEMAQAQRQAWQAEFEVKILQGILQEEAGCYSEAQVLYQTALQLARQVNDRRSMARAERTLADLIGARQQNLAAAIPHYQNAMQVYAQLGDRLNLERTRSNLAATYLQSEQYALAVEAAIPAYTFLVNAKETVNAARAAANLADAYVGLGDLAQAQAYAEKVIEFEERQPYPYALYTLGRIQACQHAWSMAQTYLEQAVQMAQQNSDPYLAAYAQRELGKVYRQVGQRQAAEQAISAALCYFGQAGMEVEVAETQRLASQIEGTRDAPTVEI
ncbi:MAG: hypothetical protein U0350_24725 [Caldilineaceae bacterium]